MTEEARKYAENRRRRNKAKARLKYGGGIGSLCSAVSAYNVARRISKGGANQAARLA